LFFLLDEGEQLIHLDDFHLLWLRCWRQPISMRFHPVGNASMIDPQMTCNATQIPSVKTRPNGLLPHFIGIAMDGWLLGVSTPTPVALVALATGLIATGFDLLL
jgi:hypothetical protein